MDRKQIIETYLELSRNAQEAEYYWENNTGSEEVFKALANNALSYYNYHGITRQELTDYNDSKRNVVKVNSTKDALAAMENFFS
jgi:hypothetical protein